MSEPASRYASDARSARSLRTIRHAGAAHRADARSRSTIDGATVTVPARHLGDARRGRGRHRRSPSCAPPTRWRPSARAACAWSRSRAARAIPASCTTPVEPGMKVRTQTPQLQQLRRGVMELYISDHPLDCLTCPRQRPLRAAGHGRRRRPARSALRLRRRQPPRRERERRATRTSASTRPSASSARAACAPARRCRARSR